MVKLSAVIILAMFMASMFIVDADKESREKRDIQIMTLDQFIQMICQNYGSHSPLCNSYTTTTTTATTTPQTTAKTTTEESAESPTGETTESLSTTQSSSTDTTTVAETTTATPSASSLERAHWCSFSNGSYLSYLQTFMYDACDICQCTLARTIRCTKLQCMTTYCIDGSAPVTRPGQCCSQCSYDQPSSVCVVNGISFPHGTVLKKTSDNIQCWCELGNVECRKAAVSATSSLDYWGEGTAVYVVVVIICVLLLIGTLACGCGALFFYYYYKRNQQSTQQAYEHYYNTAGWQPMGEDGVVIDQDAEKKAEAEQVAYEEYPAGTDEQYVPPPYAHYNGTYINEQEEKEPKYL